MFDKRHIEADRSQSHLKKDGRDKTTSSVITCASRNDRQDLVYIQISKIKQSLKRYLEMLFYVAYIMNLELTMLFFYSTEKCVTRSQ